MKKLVLVLLFLNGYVSSASHVQIDFVMGFSIGIINNYPLSPSEGTATSNTEINLIYTNHGVNHCVEDFSSNHKILFADYNGNSVNMFISDLMNNVNVSKVRICYDNSSINSYSYADRLYLKLYNNLNGNPIGTNANGNVFTTNTLLTTIFNSYNVKTMTQIIPNSLYYSIYFDGDITALKNELDNLNSVVDFTELIGVGMLLSNSNFEKSKTIISPNPFSDNFDIQTEQTITNFSIIDITGKTIANTTSKAELDNQSSQLSAGIYILNLNFDNGQTANYKLIKK